MILSCIEEMFIHVTQNTILVPRPSTREKARYTLSAHARNQILCDVIGRLGLTYDVKYGCAALELVVPRPSSRVEGLGTRLELVGRV